MAGKEPAASKEKSAPKAPAGDKKAASDVAEGGKKLEVTPDWDKVLYSPERIEMWLKGELSLKDLNAFSGPEMLELALIGFKMYEAGKYNEALTIFAGLNALDKEEPYYVIAMGAVNLALEDLEAALACFNRAIQLNAKEVSAYVNRGEVYPRQGKVEEAAFDFKKAVELDPQGKDPLTSRARVLAGAALEMIRKARGETGPAPAKGGKAAAPAKAPAPAAKKAEGKKDDKGKKPAGKKK